MLGSSSYLTFLFISFGLIIIPGPNVLFIVATSVRYGILRGLQTVLGTTLAMAVQLFIAAIGTSWLINLTGSGLLILRWTGAAYLFYLAFQNFRESISSGSSEKPVNREKSIIGGFFVSLTNPKTILFFSAFLPQFVAESDDYATQILYLSATFLMMALALDSMYAVLFSRLQTFLLKPRAHRIRHIITGLLYLGACLWLAYTVI